MRGGGRVMVRYRFLGGRAQVFLSTFKSIGINIVQCLYKGLHTVCWILKEYVTVASDLVLISLFNSFVYCRKVDDLLPVLYKIKEMSGNRVILRGQKVAGMSADVLRKMEGALESKQTENCQVHRALARLREVRETIKAWGNQKWQALCMKL